MLFEFVLRPLEEVHPWGGDKPHLSWFSLTDGWCWWNTGSQQLFRSSQVWLDRWEGEYPKLALEPPYVDYQVVRPWEDLLTCLPAVLDPVPDDLIQRVQDTRTWASLRDKAWSWAGSKNDNEAWDLQGTAFEWWSERTWDAGYLRRPPHIWLWTQNEIVHIRWDNRDVIDDGLPVWEATVGEITMPVAAFVEEAQSFNDRLMSAMADRVDAVVSGALRPEIQIDLAHLAYEQSDRATWLENALTVGRRTKARTEEDWDKVREALDTAQKICYNNGVEGL